MNSPGLSAHNPCGDAMNPLASLYDFVDTRADQVLLAQTPLLMVPRFGTMPPLEAGQRRYIAAKDGIYIQARSRAMSVSLKVANTPPLPFGEWKESLWIIGGRAPHHFFAQFQDLAQRRAPVEVAALVVWNPLTKEYDYVPRPSLSDSAGHITYRVDDVDEDYLVFDWHSHGDAEAFFSATDNISDQRGLYIATVLGRCRQPAPHWDGASPKFAQTRIVVDGFFYPVPWHPWEGR